MLIFLGIIGYLIVAIIVGLTFHAWSVKDYVSDGYALDSARYLSAPPSTFLGVLWPFTGVVALFVFTCHSLHRLVLKPAHKLVTKPLVDRLLAPKDKR